MLNELWVKGNADCKGEKKNWVSTKNKIIGNNFLELLISACFRRIVCVHHSDTDLQVCSSEIILFGFVVSCPVLHSFRSFNAACLITVNAVVLTAFVQEQGK